LVPRYAKIDEINTCATLIYFYISHLSESMEAKWNFAIEGYHLAYFFLVRRAWLCLLFVRTRHPQFYGVAMRSNST
jgi:hypothetical protein